MEPDMSSTSTMSRGVVDVVMVFDMEERAESPTRKSELPFSILTEEPTSPESVMSPSCTVLSVQIRPTFSVVFSKPTSPLQLPSVELSATVSF